MGSSPAGLQAANAAVSSKEQIGYAAQALGGLDASFALVVAESSGDRQRYAKLSLEHPLQFIELVPYAQHFKRFEIDDAARVTLVVIVFRHSIIECNICCG